MISDFLDKYELSIAITVQKPCKGRNLDIWRYILPLLMGEIVT